MSSLTSADDLAYAWGPPRCSAGFKLSPEDFRVDEILGFEPSGDGEHVYWLVEKTGMSTPELVNHLSSRLALPRRLISWSGMKDKQALTSQWIGLHTGQGAEPDPAQVQTDRIRVVRCTRNSRKLRIGVHQGNHFRICLRSVQGDTGYFHDTAAKVSSQGVPNYFGEQRFGRQGQNVDKARQMFSGERRVSKRAERSILLSAARSCLFNEVLSRRVCDGNWNRLIAGDVMALEASKAGFTPAWANLGKEERLVLQRRVEEGDIHPTGPLWGKGPAPVTLAAAAYESPEGFPPDLCQGLASAGLTQERRALRLSVHELVVEPDRQGGLVVEFRLGRGGYATSVLRELVSLKTEPSYFLQTGNTQPE